ncbi:MAG: chloride channel protein [Spirochaetales bacterium]|nr:chloride channel protein [Spirochaetales bacterium]
MKMLITREDIKSYKFLLQWLVIAILAGLVGSFSIHYFVVLYKYMIGFINSTQGIPLFLWPLLGAVLVGLVIYRIEPGAKGEGIPSYLLCLRRGNGILPPMETFYKFWAALITLGTLGNGGFLGPVGRVSAGIMSFLYRIIPKKIISKENLSLFPICGLAAAFGALIHTSVGGGIFAVEIIQKANMRYRQLFPAILASTASVYFSRQFGFEPILAFQTIHESFNIKIIFIIILLTFSAGILGKGFIILYSWISKLFHREVHLPTLGITIRAIIGSLIAFWIVYLINPNLIGTSEPIFKAIMAGDISILWGRIPVGVPLVFILLILIVIKALANCLTVGSGMSAGFAGPAILMGLLLGAVFAELFSIPAGTPEYYALLTAGFAGVFSSTMNTPIATGVIAIEMFGMFYSLPAALASVVGFQINRHNTLYDMVLDEDDDRE